MKFPYSLVLAAALIAGIASAQTAPLYYQDPSGKPAYSAAPKKDAQGRDYRPVYKDAPPAPAETAAALPTSKGKILYYRNPMGLPDTSPAPKTDSMGMDYIPVYEGDAAEAGIVKIAPGRIQQLGVRTEVAAERTMTRPIRAVGTVALDERRIAVVAPRFEGWIERLLVDTTGQPVRKGEPLAQVYSPDLRLAQQEYRVAQDAARRAGEADGMVHGNTNAIADAVLQRFRNWDVAPAGGKSGFMLTAPMDGIVLEKQAVDGLHFAAGDTLYRIGDLSTVWVLADVFEQDLGLVRPGEEARITARGSPSLGPTPWTATRYHFPVRSQRLSRSIP